MRFFDTHSHLQFPQYDEDREEVIARMREDRTSTIAVGTDLKSSRAGVALAQKVDHMWATIGVHPTDSDERFNAAVYEDMLGPKVVAIGECGFDYFRGARGELMQPQEGVFKAQIDFALAHDLPLMLHVRPSKGSEDAHEDAIRLLTSYKKEAGGRLRGTAHFFTASLQVAELYWDLGFSISIPGVVTFAPEMEDVVRMAPSEMLLSETDAPFAAPVPFRGSRNEPAYVREVVKRIAELRGVGEEEMSAVLFANACRMFSISADSCA